MLDKERQEVVRALKRRGIHDEAHKQLEPPQDIVHNSYKASANDIITTIFEYVWQKVEQLAWIDTGPARDLRLSVSNGMSFLEATSLILAHKCLLERSYERDINLAHRDEISSLGKRLSFLDSEVSLIDSIQARMEASGSTSQSPRIIESMPFNHSSYIGQENMAMICNTVDHARQMDHPFNPSTYAHEGMSWSNLEQASNGCNYFNPSSYARGVNNYMNVEQTASFSTHFEFPSYVGSSAPSSLLPPYQG